MIERYLGVGITDDAQRRFAEMDRNLRSVAEESRKHMERFNLDLRTIGSISWAKDVLDATEPLRRLSFPVTEQAVRAAQSTRSYWHVPITTLDNGKLAINTSKVGTKVALEPYRYALKGK
jgi:hypothetical protein